MSAAGFSLAPTSLTAAYTTPIATTSPDAQGFTVMVSNLAPEADDTLLWQLFAPFGSVISIKVTLQDNRIKEVTHCFNSACSGHFEQMQGLRIHFVCELCRGSDCHQRAQRHSTRLSRSAGKLLHFPFIKSPDCRIVSFQMNECQIWQDFNFAISGDSENGRCSTAIGSSHHSLETRSRRKSRGIYLFEAQIASGHFNNDFLSQSVLFKFSLTF